MSRENNVAIAQKFLALVGGGKDPDEIAALCAQDLRFEIQGDDGVLPWIGCKTGRTAVADFVGGMRTLTEPITFDVEDILASETRSAVVGALVTRIKSSGKVIRSQFAIILTVADNGVITRFQMLEDSFDVSRAVRG